MFMASLPLSKHHYRSVMAVKDGVASARLCPGMTALAGHRLVASHCHGKRREIKPETAWPFG
jgi:hypothetical protein